MSRHLGVGPKSVLVACLDAELSETRLGDLFFALVPCLSLTFNAEIRLGLDLGLDSGGSLLVAPVVPSLPRLEGLLLALDLKILQILRPEILSHHGHYRAR